MRFLAHPGPFGTQTAVVDDNYFRCHPYSPLYTSIECEKNGRNITSLGEQRVHLQEVFLHTVLSSGCDNADDYYGHKLLHARRKR